ncbi:MAG: SIMPL domain-containing protein [Alphaproteobacteria bacterium]|nr:SIMPL domain-containing protein [Alphaproteobacteria bacterium]
MTEKNNIIAAAILGILVAVGLAAAGQFVSNTVYKGRLASNAVTVKGFDERDVKADLALWQIGYSVTGGNLGDVYTRARADEAALVGFLTQSGFRPADIKSDNLAVTDLMANPYRPKDMSESARYIVKNTILVRSNDVDLAVRTTRGVSDLIKQGIVLTTNDVDYEFTKLNDIKAAMLRAATQNARDAAQQFANDAGSKVGSIQSASQGFFSIVSRDAAAAAGGENASFRQGMGPISTIDKQVRVVVTLTYYLER